MPKLLLSKQIVDETQCPIGRLKIGLYDVGCKGLFLEIRPNGRKTYFLRFIDARSKQRLIRVADQRDVTLTQARQIADKYRNQIALGQDPSLDKETLKTIPQLADFIAQQYLPYVKTYKRSWVCDVGVIKNHINPVFGAMYMDELKKQDVIQLISKLLERYAPGTVNRVVILLRYIYNLAIKWETAGILKNPTAGIPLLEENNQKERYLTPEEARKLVAALKGSENKMLQFIIPMLILTGARKMEVQKARWEDINWEQRIWRIPLTKSGKARHVPISDGALMILESIPRIGGCPWVFPNPKTHKPYNSYYNSWNTVRKSVGLGDVRIHDLRHSFASFLVNSGRSLYEVQRILGHTQISTTQRYAHLSQDSLLTAANEIGKAIPSLMSNRIETIPMLATA
jgi:integrase